MKIIRLHRQGGETVIQPQFDGREVFRRDGVDFKRAQVGLIEENGAVVVLRN